MRMKGGCSGEYFCITGNSSSIPGQQSHENCHSLHTRLPEIPRLLIGPFILILAAMACTDPSSHTNLAYTHTQVISQLSPTPNKKRHLETSPDSLLY